MERVETTVLMVGFSVSRQQVNTDNREETTPLKTEISFSSSLMPVPG